jgi:hypothetical protein
MAVTRVARIAAVAPVRAISERPVGEVVFDEGALGGVGVVEKPPPGCAEKRQGALGVADSEAAEQFKGCCERRNVEWELGAYGTDRGPIEGQAGGDGWNGGVGREVEEEGEGVCVLWVYVCRSVIVFICAVGSVETSGIDGATEGAGQCCPGGCEISILLPGCEASFGKERMIGNRVCFRVVEALLPTAPSCEVQQGAVVDFGRSVSHCQPIAPS